MPSPFPGMNPWLEAPELWPGVHARLIAEVSNTLSAAIPARYFVDVEERVYVCEIEDPYVRLIVPDNVVRETQKQFSAIDQPAATATITPSLQAQLFDPEIRERRIVIQSVDDQSIVPLPTIPVPLLPGDPDVPLHLQAILHDGYAHSGYVRRLNCAQPAAPPPISDSRMEWLKGFLQLPTP